MGVTIHYHGALDDPARLDAGLAMLREECERRGWPYRELDLKARGPHETYTFRDVPGPLPGWTDMLTETEVVELDTRWRGLSIDPHPKCESLLMMFDERDARIMLLMADGNTQRVMYSQSVKTQFAPPEIHVAICEVLHRLQNEYGRAKFVVDDEGGYFDTQDMDAMIMMRDVIEEGMQNIELISHIVQLGTIGDKAAPPDQSELFERRN